MQKGNSARRFVSLGVALMALVALTVSLGAGAASAGPGHAVTAKKKCKKAKKGAVSAKKKKCKRKKQPLTPVQLPPAPGPIVRATLSWSADDEVDLHAFDASGNHSGWAQTGPTTFGVVQGIPNATHNGDAGPGGPSESFTDNIFVAGGSTNREFAYVACLYNGPALGSYSATFTEVSSDGQTISVPLSGPTDAALTVTGGPTVPSDPC